MSSKRKKIIVIVLFIIGAAVCWLIYRMGCANASHLHIFTRDISVPISMDNYRVDFDSALFGEVYRRRFTISEKDYTILRKALPCDPDILYKDESYSFNVRHWSYWWWNPSAVDVDEFCGFSHEQCSAEILFSKTKSGRYDVFLLESCGT